MDVFTKEDVFIDVRCNYINDVFNYIARKAFDRGYTNNVDKVVNSFKHREKECSTGMQDGIAIPHAMCDSILCSKVIIVKLLSPIQWKSLDEKPINFIVSLLISAGGSREHLRILSKVATSLLKKESRTQLTQSKSTDEIFDLMCKYLKAN